jgi:hypothetical protein
MKVIIVGSYFRSLAVGASKWDAKASRTRKTPKTHPKIGFLYNLHYNIIAYYVVNLEIT